MDDEIAETEGSHEPTEFKKEPRKAVASDIDAMASDGVLYAAQAPVERRPRPPSPRTPAASRCTSWFAPA